MSSTTQSELVYTDADTVYYLTEQQQQDLNGQQIYESLQVPDHMNNGYISSQGELVVPSTNASSRTPAVNVVTPRQVIINQTQQQHTVHNDELTDSCLEVGNYFASSQGLANIIALVSSLPTEPYFNYSSRSTARLTCRLLAKT